MKIYQVGQSEQDRLEAVALLEEHGFDPGEVYRVVVDVDIMTVYRYDTPRRVDESGEVVVLPQVSIPL